MQAQDRAYRLGQQRKVQVYRLVTKGTIDELCYLGKYTSKGWRVAIEGKRQNEFFGWMMMVAERIVRYPQAAHIPQGRVHQYKAVHGSKKRNARLALDNYRRRLVVRAVEAVMMVILAGTSATGEMKMHSWHINPWA